jgi:hypothetical protein
MHSATSGWTALLVDMRLLACRRGSERACVFENHSTPQPVIAFGHVWRHLRSFAPWGTAPPHPTSRIVLGGSKPPDPARLGVQTNARRAFAGFARRFRWRIENTQTTIGWRLSYVGWFLRSFAPWGAAAPRTHNIVPGELPFSRPSPRWGFNQTLDEPSGFFRAAPVERRRGISSTGGSHRCCANFNRLQILPKTEYFQPSPPPLPSLFAFLKSFFTGQI